jgi:hypothetical protein
MWFVLLVVADTIEIFFEVLSKMEGFSLLIRIMMQQPTHPMMNDSL